MVEKEILKMNDVLKEKLKRITNDNSDMVCEFCKYDLDCSHGVTNCGGEPSYPPCADGNVEEYIDFDLVEEYKEEEEN